MSGKVKIEAVGRGNEYKVIEDNYNSCNLDISYDKDYGVLIPNMPITIYANCRVKRSTTKPLLRAMMTMTLFDTDHNPIDEDKLNVQLDMYRQLTDVITNNTNWYYHTDGFYYLLDDASTNAGDNAIMQEVDATSGDKIVEFLNKPIVVPKTLDSSYSGMRLRVIVTFQAIQNYIPDNAGNKLPNTIANAQKIFEDFELKQYESSPISWFDITTTSDGKVSLATKEGMNYPQYIRLPEKTSDGRTITNISTNLFKGNPTVQKVYIPSSYTSMENEAFAYSGILSVDASDSGLTVIPTRAFRYSKLISIKLPDTLVRIGTSAFSYSTLQSINLPDSLLQIYGDALWQCHYLESLHIPSNVTLYDNAVGYNRSLKSITVDENNAKYYDIDNKLLVSSSGELITCATASMESDFILPDSITSLCQYSLSLAPITNLTLNKNLQEVGEYALPVKLKQIELGNNTNFKLIYDTYNNLFFTDKNVESVVWLNINTSATSLSFGNIKYLKFNVSNNTNITKIEFGENFDASSMSVISNFIGTTEYSVSSSNKSIKTVSGKEILSADGKTFYVYAASATGTSYTVPSGVTEIYQRAFADSKYLYNLTLANTVEKLYWYSFSNSKIMTININAGMKISDTDAIMYLNFIESISMYGTIRNNNLYNCRRLKYVTVNDSVDIIGMNFLSDCPMLEWVEFTNSTPPTFESGIMLQNSNSNYVIYVPDDAVDAYKTAHNFSSFASHIKPISQKV